MSEQVEVQTSPVQPTPREVIRFDIVNDISSKLGTQITSLLRSDDKQKPIHVEMCSHGGDSIAGLLIMDVIGSQNVPVTFFCGTHNYSMAPMVIQGYDFLRLCYPASRFMFHETGYSFDGSKRDVEEVKRWAEIGVERINEITKSAIGLGDKEFNKKINSGDRYFLPKEMLAMGEHGAIDGIIQTRLADHVYLCETRDGLKVIDTFVHRRSDIKNLPVWTKPE